MIVILLGMVFGCYGCTGSLRTQKTGPQRLLNTSQEESVYDAAAALTAVTGAMSSKEVSEEDLYQAAKDMRNDPEARSAVEAISSAFETETVDVKYSPATGKRYSADMDIDPETGVKLLPLK